MARRYLYGSIQASLIAQTGKLLTITEVLEVHAMALGPAWDVAPHPYATDRKRPGSFRGHDIQPFPGGMTPTPWPEVPSAIRTWIDGLNDIAAADLPIEALALARAVLHNLYRFVVSVAQH